MLRGQTRLLLKVNERCGRQVIEVVVFKQILVVVQVHAVSAYRQMLPPGAEDCARGNEASKSEDELQRVTRSVEKKEIEKHIGCTS